VFFKTDNSVNTTYLHPEIKDVKIDIDGATNQLFTSEYLSPYAYQYAQRYFKLNRHVEAHINQQSFYTNKYCLAIHLRTLDDEQSSGIGRKIRDYIKLKISKKATTAAGKAFVFLVSDKAVSFENNQIKSIEQ
jgi:hypothetical protein